MECKNCVFNHNGICSKRGMICSSVASCEDFKEKDMTAQTTLL